MIDFELFELLEWYPRYWAKNKVTFNIFYLNHLVVATCSCWSMTLVTSPAIDSSFSWMGPAEELFTSSLAADPRWYRLGSSWGEQRGQWRNSKECRKAKHVDKIIEFTWISKAYVNDASSHRFRVPGIFDKVLGYPNVLQYDVCLRVSQRVQVVLHLHTDSVNHLKNKKVYFWKA